MRTKRVPYFPLMACWQLLKMVAGDRTELITIMTAHPYYSGTVLLLKKISECLSTVPANPQYFYINCTYGNFRTGKTSGYRHRIYRYVAYCAVD